MVRDVSTHVGRAAAAAMRLTAVRTGTRRPLSMVLAVQMWAAGAGSAGLACVRDCAPCQYFVADTTCSSQGPGGISDLVDRSDLLGYTRQLGVLATEKSSSCLNKKILVFNNCEAAATALSSATGHLFHCRIGQIYASTAPDKAARDHPTAEAECTTAVAALRSAIRATQPPSSTPTDEPSPAPTAGPPTRSSTPAPTPAPTPGDALAPQRSSSRPSLHPCIPQDPLHRLLAR